ncbi:MAG: amidohydrolase family protein [Acidimicrobiales bacterium]|nr:amidohydrolase family protein [Acidimicrobiales bacterium]
MITVFTAKQIHTMDPSMPQATAVACRDGRVVEVGSLESMRPWLDRHEHVVDERFADLVMLPGLIDPHVHPGMASLLLAMHWITPEPWTLPAGSIDATESNAQYLERLAALIAAHPDGPLITFGFQSLWHGEVTRSDLDALDASRPVVLWQRSFHELRCNTSALEWLDAFEGAKWDPHIDTDTGRLYESGMVWGLRTLVPHLVGGGRFQQGVREVAQLCIDRGVTTIADAGYGIVDFDLELDTIDDVFGSSEPDVRVWLMANIPRARGAFGEGLMDRLEEHAAERETNAVKFLRAAKFFSDGSFIAQLMQLGSPGYIDGHEGAWISTPEQLTKMARPWWNADYQINIHTNGDAGVDSCLDAVDALLRERPRFDHRTVLHHFGISTQAQVRRAAALGVSIQANGYFLQMFGDAFVDRWLGFERASAITRVGSARRAGMSVAVHSDFPMGPIDPLQAVTNMATRTTRGGLVLGPSECLTTQEALEAVTIEAAAQLGLDSLIGSVASGKFADMTVLAADPFEVGAANVGGIDVVATVVGGRVVSG